MEKGEDRVIDEERLVRVFTELVGIDSETGSEAKIAHLLKQKFAALGLTVVEDRSSRVAGLAAANLVFTLPGNADGLPIFFGAHMDTAAPGKNIRPSIHDGAIISDGTTILGADDKAALSALLEAFRQIRERHLAHGALQVVVTAGEESGLRGAKAFDPGLLDARFGFVLDSDGPVGSIVVDSPYMVKSIVTIQGENGAHNGFSSEKRKSAVAVATKAIASLPLGRIDRDTVVKIHRIEGGRANDTGCDAVRIIIEIRSFSQASLQRQIDRMADSFRQTAIFMNGKATVRSTFIYPGYRFSAQDPLVRMTDQAVRAIGRVPRLIRGSGGSDAGVFTGKGIPTLNLGVGYQYMHTRKEQMPIAELVKSCELVLSLVKQAVTWIDGDSTDQSNLREHDG